MSGTINRDRQAQVADISFGLMGLIGVIGLVADSFDTTPSPAYAPVPWLTGIAAAVLMVVIALVVTRLSSLDRKRSEEYTFQIMANAAVVSIMTTLIVSFAWSNDLLLGRWLGEPSLNQVQALILGSWSIGYFTYRARGTGL